MLLDADHNLDITCLYTRDLVTLTVECHDVLIGGARLDVYFQFFLTVEYLLSLAFLTDIGCLYPLSFTSTVLTVLLYVLVHTGT